MVCAAAFGAVGPARAQSQTLMLANSDALESITDRMNKFFKADLEKRSNGQIRVNYIAGQSLGSAPQVMDQMIAGTVESFGNTLDWFGPLDTDFQVLNWGFTFRDDKHLVDFLKSATLKTISDRVREKHGIRLLAAAPTQTRIIFSTRPIRSAADLVNLKMRVPQIEVYLELWTALGTKPTQVPWGEVFLALKTGVAEAAEGPPNGGFAQKFHEAAKEMTITNHVVSILCFSINEKRFQRFTPEQQGWLKASAEAAVTWGHEQSKAETETVLKKMVDQGARLHTMDVRPLQEKTAAALDRLEAKGLWRKGLWAEIQAIR
jgi:TRAP-type C4-dicarboxylate transport system substrate-binding protein